MNNEVRFRSRKVDKSVLAFDLPTNMTYDPYTKVIACGHRSIIVKSGNSFPAFLIRFPSLGSISKGASNQGTADTQTPKFCYFWRSKRDFLLLNRSLQKRDPSKAFPKSAFSKLCSQAISNENDNRLGPWVRPDDDEAPPGGYSELVLSSSTCTTSDGTSLPSAVINFDMRLKKSLYMVDSFLCRAKNLYCSGTLRDDTKTTYFEYSDDVLDGIVDAWTLFCREQDTVGLAHMPERGKCSLYSQINEETSWDHAGEERSIGNAARLGQYFASKENAKVVSVDKIEKMINFL
ncbi:hypothetical protein ACHAWX_002734 [Stephanocyclus meneghinianus]